MKNNFKNKKKLKKSTRGITLIALVVTIIVLLILAGISVAMLIGDNNIINKAGSAKELTEKLQMEEQIKLTNLEFQNKRNINEEPDKAVEYFRKHLGTTYGQDNVEVWAVNSNNGSIIRIDINKSASYIIYDDKTEENTEYKNEAGTTYRKFEIFNGTNSPGTRYRNCVEMIAILLPDYEMSYPYQVSTGMFSGNEKLRSIKIPVSKNGGHYIFSGLPNLEYLELGSVDYPWDGAGYFMSGTYPGGYSTRTIGTPAGLTIEAYMNSYNSTAGFNGVTPSPNTTIIIRSAETGEIIKPE